MKNRFQLFALGIALAVPWPASAADAFRAVLRASGGGVRFRAGRGETAALVVLDGTFLTLFLPESQAERMREVHLRKGSAAGEIIISLDSGVLARSSRIGAALAADIVAHPQTYFVDAQKRGFPGSPTAEYRGRLTPAPGQPLASWFFAPEGTSGPASSPQPPGSRAAR